MALLRITEAELERSCMRPEAELSFSSEFFGNKAKMLNATEESKQGLILPPPKTQSFNQRGGHTIRHYALWAAYSNHAYKSQEFVDDGEARREWWSKIHLCLNIWVYLYPYIFDYLTNEYRGSTSALGSRYLLSNDQYTVVG